jgi:hypothetical protein
MAMGARLFTSVFRIALLLRIAIRKVVAYFVAELWQI